MVSRGSTVKSSSLQIADFGCSLQPTAKVSLCIVVIRKDGREWLMRIVLTTNRKKCPEQVRNRRGNVSFSFRCHPLIVLLILWPLDSTMNTATASAAKKEVGDAYVLVRTSPQDRLEQGQTERRNPQHQRQHHRSSASRISLAHHRIFNRSSLLSLQLWRKISIQAQSMLQLVLAIERILQPSTWSLPSIPSRPRRNLRNSLVGSSCPSPLTVGIMLEHKGSRC